MNCHKEDEDGWDNHKDHDEDAPLQQEPLHLRYQRQLPRQILDTAHHSLEPDMVFGWRPKLPSCPLPLTYTNTRVESLLLHLQSDDRFQIKYLGPRYSNSVQLNQQYEYAWRYRSRYCSSIEVVRQAVRKVGEVYRSSVTDVVAGELRFESEFEGGNLDMAVKIKKAQYDLFLRSDTNTRGHTSWYYFKVNNNDQIGEVQFNIANFGKNKNLYSAGLRPYCLTTGAEWGQTGAYDVNWVERLCRYGFDRKSFQLQFKYNFKQKNQQVYFAYAIPYTYSRLQNFITDIKHKYGRYIKTAKLCETLGGLDVPLLTITNAPEGSENSDDNTAPYQNRRKKIVLVTGRIHPGQTHSSFVLQGFIKALLTEDPSSQSIRNSFVFYIVPMINPDGVVAGNFRTSFSGRDLNRQFNNLNKNVFPQITSLHELALQLKRSYKSAFQFYFDFHAHSSKKGLFCYGPEHGLGKPYFFRARALAKLVEQKSALFSYKRSIFTVNQIKKTTGRAHMLWKIKVPMAFTFQVSCGLFDNKQTRNLALKQTDLLQLGNSVVSALDRYSQLELKVPSLKVIAKVDTGIKKRGGVSVKEFRKSLTKKGKTLTIKDITHAREASNTHSNKDSNPISLQDLLDQSSIQLKKYQNVQDSQQYLKIIEEIKNQQKQEPLTDEYEGGSDSESQDQDLIDQQLKKLHKMIEARNDNQKSYSKCSVLWKIQNKMQIRRQFESQQTKEVLQQVEGPKKRVTSKYLQPLKNLPLPPRAKRFPLFETQKIVLPPKNFALQI